MSGSILWRYGGETEPVLLRGGGLSLNVAVVPERFEIELVAQAYLAEGGIEVPIDLLAMLPIQLTRRVQLYVGVGPTLAPFALPERSGVLYGLATAVGVDLLFNASAGLFVEASYNLLTNGEGRIFHDVGFGFGPTIGF